MAVVFMLDSMEFCIDLVIGDYKPGQWHITGVHKRMDPPSVSFPGDHTRFFTSLKHICSTHGIPMVLVVGFRCFFNKQLIL